MSDECLSTHYGPQAEQGPQKYPWWDPYGDDLCVWAVYEPAGAVDLADSYVDRSGNGNDCSAGVAPDWDSTTGWQFNGTTQYIKTEFTPDPVQGQSMIIEYNGLGDVGGTLSGCYRVLFGEFGIEEDAGLSTFQYQNGGTASGAVQELEAGNVCVAGTDGYFDGEAEGLAIGAWAAPAVDKVYIGARNNAGAADQFCALYITRYALYDCTLTANQVAAIRETMGRA